MFPLPSLKPSIIKDYYQILKLDHEATLDEVKRSYHNLALHYHPDKNPDNALTSEYFIEIQEAYSVLSNLISRTAYDKERLMAGMDRVKKKDKSPEQILLEIQRITADVRRMTAYRIDTSWLKATLRHLISTQNVAILLKDGWADLREAYLEDYLWLLTYIPYPYAPEIFNNLNALVSMEELAKQQLQLFMESRKREHLIRKFIPFSAVIITLTLCFFMYHYGKV